MSAIHYLHDDIAVVGWSCRLPGAKSPAELWSLLLEGRCAISQVPPDRYALQHYRHPRRQERGKSYTWAAGILEDVWDFDPAVFGISPREAEQMDPQQRIMLQLAWEALEDAGIRPSSVAGTEVGVYVGASTSEYAHSLYGDLAAADSHFATGISLSIIANRISYAFDLHGPSMTVDTACSSSLVALNQAFEALRSGRIDTAIVGGINVLASPAPFVLFSQAMMLSPTGLCRAFSDDADGFVRAEGGVAIVLRKAAVAKINNNPIRGIILASDVNSDGSTNGISLPSEAAQERLIARVYSRAGIEPDRLAFVEAHGTGTQAGDPVEARALGRSLGLNRAQVLPIGSVKTNVGHLEPASGLVGLLKALLALNHGLLPANLHFNKPNPNIAFDDLNLAVCDQPLLLPNSEQSCAGVNSFGFGGTNAHVVLAPGERSLAQARWPKFKSLGYFSISAETKPALTALARKYIAQLAGVSDEESSVVVSAAAHRRDQLANRVVVATSRNQDVVDALTAFVDGSGHQLLTAGEAVGTELPVVFVYSGNGSQWVGMGVTAYKYNADFRARFDEVDQCFGSLAKWSLKEALTSEQLRDRLKQTSVAQPLIFAVQCATTAALRKCGLHPSVVLGHSVGEVAASEAAGILDLRTAVKVIHFRSLYQELVYGHGRMAAVLASRETVEALIASVGKIEIAATNSPRAITVAGPADSLAAFTKAATARGIAVLDLDLEYPFHSTFMAPIEERLTTALNDITPQAGQVPFISTVTGSMLPGSRLGANYWWRNIREPVQFSTAAREAVALGGRCFVEIGPRPMLLKHVADSLDGVSSNFATLSALNNSDHDRDPFPAVISKAIVSGAKIETTTVFGPDPGATISLPSYPWQQTKFHFASTVEGVGLGGTEQHPLAGGRYTPDALEWHCHVDTMLFPRLADHKLGNQVVFPGTGFIEIALFVTRQWLKSDNVALANFETLKALDLTKGQTIELMTRVSAGSQTIEIFSRPRLSNANWVLNCRGKMLQGYPNKSISVPACGRVLKSYDRDFIYKLSAANGLPYGPAFQLVRKIKAHSNNLISVELTPDTSPNPYVLDPVRLDCCTHGIFLVYPEVDAEKRGVTYIPVRLEEAIVLGNGTPHAAVIEVLSKNDRAIIANYYISGADGELIAVLRGVRCQAVPISRTATLEAVGLVELPVLIDGSLVGVTGVMARAADVLMHARSQGLLSNEAKPGEATRLIEGWATTAAYEIATALADDFRIVPDLLVANGQLSAELRPWFVSLLIHLGAAGLAKQGENDWVLAQDALLPSSASMIKTLASEYPSRAGELLLAGAVSGFVAQICAKKTIAMPPKDVLSAATLDFYETASATANSENEALSLLLEGVDGIWPPERGLRVLQIGTGATSGLLATFRRVGNVQLTVFEPDHRRIESARPMLARFGRVKFLEPGQAIPAGSFDLIIAAEGLHRLPIGVTLATLRAAMAPRGLLLATEQRPSLFHDLVFGLAPDWFATGIADFPVGRLWLADWWKSELDAVGFANVHIANINYGSDVASLIVAEADVAAGEQTGPANLPASADRRSVTIIDQQGARESELAAILARNLLNGGHDTVLVNENARDSKSDIVVHFPSLVDYPLGPMELLSARCLDIKTCAERIDKKGTALWFVFFGALSHANSKVRPVETGAWAFARTVANELQHLDVRRIDVLPHVSPRLAAERIRDIILSGTEETELQIDTAGIRAVRVDSVRRAIEANVGVPAPAARLQRQAGPGQRLHWQPIERVAPAADQVEIEVECTGMNFRDLMWMLSLLPDDIIEDGFSGATLGLECSGRVVRVGSNVKHISARDRVMSLAASAFSTHVTIPAAHAVKLPANISMEGAATIPVAFFTAYYSLIRLARLKRDEWVLIHGGAGGVGMAAIQIAQTRGARVIATAGSKAKRDLLRALGVADVFDSRSTAFVDEVRNITGEGVDVVLNSLAGEAMERSVACLRTFGRFVELGKRDYVNNTHMGLRPFSKNLSYFGVDLDQLTVSRPDVCEKIYTEVIHQFSTGAFKPLPHSVFSSDNVADAFHFMQQSSHIGKIVVRPPKADSIRVTTRPFEINTNGTHFITGAFGGFGLETAKWLVDKGVRHLVMIGRHGAASEEAKVLLNSFAGRGVIVVQEACDVSDFHALEKLFKKIKSSMPPLVGVIHAAMVLEDAILANLDADRLNRVLAPKVKGAENLDNLTRSLKLDYFVLFSTLVTLIGNAGQGNYVAANAFMEGLARRRRQDGLPALAIGWGPIADVGVLVRKQMLESSIKKLSGVRSMTAREGLELMLQALAQADNDANLAVVTIAPNSGGFGGGHLAVLRSPTYAGMARTGSGRPEDAVTSIDVRALLKTEPMDVVRRIVADGIVAQLAGVLHAREENISRMRPLGEIGLDSLMALELGMNIETVFEAHISLAGSLGTLTISELADEVIAQVRPDHRGDTDVAIAVAERHVGKIGAAHVDIMMEVLRDDAERLNGLAS